jgi:quinol monooxygenase YgiN
MKVRRLMLIGAAMMASLSLAGPAMSERTRSAYVRLAELEIDPAQLERFQASVNEEIEASIRLEPGVLALYAVSLKDNPAQVRVFEMYTDAAAYAAHLETPHFRKFKAETEHMVRSLRLLDAMPVALGAKGR